MTRAAVELPLPTDRDFDLAEVALAAAADTCQSGATLRGMATDPLAAEYLHALDAITRLRKVGGLTGRP